MKKCPNCNQSFSSDNDFCPDDGTPLVLEADVFQSSGQIPTQYVPHRQNSASAPARNSSNLLYLVIGVAGIVVVAISIVTFLPRHYADNSPADNFTTVQTKVVATDTVSNKTMFNSTRFIQSACGSIQDGEIGLEWYISPDKNVTWYAAQQWTNQLSVCGGSWRMPTIREIQTLFDTSKKAGIGYFSNGQHFPAHIDPAFNSIGNGSWVWSSSPPVANMATSFNLNQGKEVRYDANNTTYTTRAFAVRNLSGQQ